MAGKKQSKSANFYVQRLLEDEYVQGQLRDAASGIRAAYDRIRKKPERAAEDKKFYSNVRQVETSIRNAVLALRRPEPEPEPRHRLRTVLIVVAVVSGSVFIISKRGSTSESTAGSDADAAEAFKSDGAPEQPPESQTAPSTTSE